MNVSDHLQKLEEKLFQSSTRKSADDIAILLAEEFVEFGSSGRIFNKQQTIENLRVESQVPRSLIDFKAMQLAPDVVLVTYRAIQHKTTEQGTIISLRSSIWKLIDDRWQMVFHQGTLSTDCDITSNL